MSSGQEKLLETLFACSAWHKFREGRKSELTFADACYFWGITENMPANVIATRLERLRIDLMGIENHVGPDGAAVLSDGRSVSFEDICTLSDTDVFLQGRFCRHLNRLRG
jgi:hypothetical protein